MLLSIYQLSERVEQLEGTIDELEEKEKEAKHAISLWESRCEELEGATSMSMPDEGEKADLISQIEAYEKSVKEHADAIDQLQLAITERDNAIAASQDQISTLTKELNEAGDQYEGVLNQWQGKFQTDSKRPSS